MTVTAIVGAQWGDEGKGRIVDYLAQRADMVIRFQGGDNAGHTVVNELGTFKLHLVPSGIFNPATQLHHRHGHGGQPRDAAGGDGGVGAARASAWTTCGSRSAPMSCCPIIGCWTGWRRAARGGSQIGTTKRGIGPAYADKAGAHRRPPGRSDAPLSAGPRLAQALQAKNLTWQHFGSRPWRSMRCSSRPPHGASTLGPRIVDTLPMIQQAQCAAASRCCWKASSASCATWTGAPIPTSPPPTRSPAARPRAPGCRPRPSPKSWPW